MIKALIQPGRMGDLLICQGLARSLDITHWVIHRQYDYVFKKHWPEFRTVLVQRYRHRDAYRQLDRIGNYEAVDILFGFDPSRELHKRFFAGNVPFDEFKYQVAGVPFERKWTHFTWKRNLEGESKVLKSLHLEKPYVFVHDTTDTDNTTPIEIDAKNVIRPQVIPGTTLLDWYQVLCNAEEVHCIDSSFANFIELANIPVKKYLYLSNRGSTTGEYKNILTATYRSDWVVI